MTDIPNLTLDQKLKAFELAMNLFDLDEPPNKENASQEEFNRHLDEYFKMAADFASLILGWANRVYIHEP
jgi:hypothetical protein